MDKRRLSLIKPRLPRNYSSFRTFQQKFNWKYRGWPPRNSPQITSTSDLSLFPIILLLMPLLFETGSTVNKSFIARQVFFMHATTPEQLCFQSISQSSGQSWASTSFIISKKIFWVFTKRMLCNLLVALRWLRVQLLRSNRSVLFMSWFLYSTCAMFPLFVFSITCALYPIR